MGAKRQVDILEAFAERAQSQGTRFEEDFLESHALYMPPWRERTLDGELGPCFGPRTAAAYDRAREEYAQSTAGGGLWDSTAELQSNQRAATRAGVAKCQRIDAEQVQHWVNRHSHEISMRHLEAYFAFYRDGMSIGQTARCMGIARETARSYLKDLRRRMRRANPPTATDGWDEASRAQNETERLYQAQVDEDRRR